MTTPRHRVTSGYSSRPGKLVRARLSRLLVALAGASDVVLVEVVDEGAARDADHLGGAGLVAGAALEDALFLELGDGGADLARHVGGAGRGSQMRRDDTLA
jgi:hypothetical protein